MMQLYKDTISVSILVLPESSMMCVASVVEPLRAANRVAGKRLYDWKLCSIDGEPVTMSCNLPLAIKEAFNGNETGDLLIIVAGFNHHRHVSSYNLGKIRNAALGFSQVAGVEAGSWIVARTGILNGRRATTHWEDFEAFASAFPEIEMRLERFVIDGNYMTCAGASPAFDMFLELIRMKNGPAIAMQVASVFVHDESHSPFDTQPLVSLGRVAKREPRLEQAVRLMEKSIEQPISTAAIAKRVGVSTGTLETLFKRHMAMTPGRFYIDLRLKAANRLVLDSNLDLHEIAIRSGFNSLSAFSRAFSNRFGKPASEVRAGR